MTTVRIYDVKQNCVVTIDKIEKSDAEWQKLLTKEQYEITTSHRHRRHECKNKKTFRITEFMYGSERGG